MGRSRRRRHEDEWAAETQAGSAPARVTDRVSPLQRRILDLQRDAGNAAVARLLGGQGAVVARAARRRRRERAPEIGLNSLTIPGLLARAPVRVTSFGPKREERAGSRMLENKDVTLEIDAGSALEALRDAMTNQTLFPWASLAGGGLTVLLKRVLIASLETVGGGRSRLVLSPDEVVTLP